MKFIVIIFAGLLCGVLAYPRNGPQCQAPNGGGITPVFKEFVEMLPLEEIITIYLNAVSNDLEVQAVMEYLGSDEFIKIISAVTATSEFYKLLNTACNDIYFDVVYYLNILNDFLGLPHFPRPVFKNFVIRGRSGFHGMLLDLIEVINVDDLKELFIEKSKTDQYVKKALEIIESQDFINIIDTLRKTPSYNQMLNELRGMGVNVDDIIEFIRKYFGW